MPAPGSRIRPRSGQGSSQPTLPNGSSLPCQHPDPGPIPDPAKDPASLPYPTDPQDPATDPASLPYLADPVYPVGARIQDPSRIRPRIKKCNPYNFFRGTWIRPGLFYYNIMIRAGELQELQISCAHLRSKINSIIVWAGGEGRPDAMLVNPSSSQAGSSCMTPNGSTTRKHTETK